MARLTAFAAAAALTIGLALSMGYALGQSPKELQGTWMVVSAETTAPDERES